MPKLPRFKNDDEFADFVDTHDMADYWDEFEDVPVTVQRSTFNLIKFDNQNG